MRNLFAILTLVVALVGCDKSHDENGGLNVSIDGAVTTTINVSVDEASSRAVAGEDSAVGVFDNGILDSDDVTMRYIMQIFIDGEQATKYIEYSDGESVAFNPELVPNRDYKFVVWADVVTKDSGAKEFSNVDNHYNTGDLTNITLKGDWNAMDESRDAFTGFAEEDNFACDHNVNINLTRPFAKLRIVATDKASATRIPAYGKVTYTTSHRVAFDATTGKSAAASLAGKIHSYTIGTYTQNTDTEYTIFSDYFFAEEDIISLTFALYEDEAMTKIINEQYTVNDVQVQRNRLSTIKGKILSGGEVVTDGIARIGSIQYKTLQAAFDAVKPGETIVLLKNLAKPDGRKDGNYAYTLNHGYAFTLDLNGKTITTNNQNETMFKIESNTSVTIKNGSLNLVSENLPKREYQALPSGLKYYQGEAKNGANDRSTGAKSVVYCNGGNISMNDVKIEGGEFGGTNTIEVHNGSGTFNKVNINLMYGCGIYGGSGSTTTLTGCNIKLTGVYYPSLQSACFAVDGGTMTVNSGTYELIGNGEYIEGGSKGGSVGMIKNGGGTLTLNGGTHKASWHLEYRDNSYNPQKQHGLFYMYADSGKSATLNVKSGVAFSPIYFGYEANHAFVESGGGNTAMVLNGTRYTSGYDFAIWQSAAQSGSGINVTYTIR